jgi:hypothetical protein
MQSPRAMQAAFHPICKPPTGFTAGSVGVASAVLVADSTDQFSVRRLIIANTHATQDLALFFVRAGTAAGLEVITTAGGLIVFARTTREVLVQGNMRVLVVGSGADTTYNGFVEDV